jgi:hypothetical protein
MRTSAEKSEERIESELMAPRDSKVFSARLEILTAIFNHHPLSQKHLIIYET